MEAQESSKANWEKVREEPLGSGGQSTVYLVRRPERVRTRIKSFESLKRFSGQDLSNRGHAAQFAQASADIARDDYLSELAALKVFNPRAAGLDAEEEALKR